MSSAQEEFNSLVSRSEERNTSRHPEDSRSNTSTPHNSRSDHNDNVVDDYLTDDDDNTGNHKNNKKASNSRSDSSDMRSKYFLPTTIRSEANTGPKGVIADAHNFETAKRSARFSFFRSRSSNSNNNNHGAVASLPEPYAATATASSSMMSSVTDNSSEEEEDEFMARWRQTRLAQLQRETQSRSRTVSPSKRIWGRLVSVDACGYLDAIEKVRADTIVVVLVYDDNVSSS